RRLAAKSVSIAKLHTAVVYYLAHVRPQLDHLVVTLPLPVGAHGAPLELRYGQLLAMALILFLAVINYFGVKLGGEVQVAVTVVKVGLIFFIIAAGLGWGHRPVQAALHASAAPMTFAGFFAAMVAALWAYDGWNNVSMVSSEIRQPQKTPPLAFIWRTAAVVGIYILANLAYFYVLAPQEVAASNRVAADMMRRVLGSAGADIVSVAAMISIFAALNGSILSGDRVPYAA